MKGYPHYHTKKSGIIIILDPAPAVKLSDELLSNIDYLLPNEHELDLVLGDVSGTPAEKSRILIKKGVGKVILTEGNKGVTIISDSSEIKIEAPKMNVVDTTAAGDTFAGAFAYGLAKDWEMTEAADFAVKAASLSVTRVGAQSSIPWLKEVEKIGESHESMGI